MTDRDVIRLSQLGDLIQSWSHAGYALNNISIMDNNGMAHDISGVSIIYNEKTKRIELTFNHE